MLFKKYHAAITFIQEKVFLTMIEKKHGQLNVNCEMIAEEKINLGKKNLIISLPAEKVLQSKIILPKKMKDKEIFAYLEVYQNKFFSQPFNQLAIDFYELPALEENKKEIHILAVEKNFVIEIVNKLGCKNIKNLKIEFDLQAAYKLLVLLFKKLTLAALVYVYKNKLLIVIGNKENCFFAKNFPLSGFDKNEEINDYVDFTFNEFLQNYPLMEIEKLYLYVEEETEDIKLNIDFSYVDIGDLFKSKTHIKHLLGLSLLLYEKY